MNFLEGIKNSAARIFGNTAIKSMSDAEFDQFMADLPTAGKIEAQNEILEGMKAEIATNTAAIEGLKKSQEDASTLLETVTAQEATILKLQSALTANDQKSTANSEAIASIAATGKITEGGSSTPTLTGSEAAFMSNVQKAIKINHPAN